MGAGWELHQGGIIFLFRDCSQPCASIECCGRRRIWSPVLGQSQQREQNLFQCSLSNPQRLRGFLAPEQPGDPHLRQKQRQSSASTLFSTNSFSCLITQCTSEKSEVAYFCQSLDLKSLASFTSISCMVMFWFPIWPQQTTPPKLVRKLVLERGSFLKERFIQAL